MQRTKIQYLTHTWNPISMKCTPVSDGCKNCWHLRMAKRLNGMVSFHEDVQMAYHGGDPVLRTDELSAPIKLRKSARIGVQFMGDPFHQSIPFEWIASVYGVMAATPQHQYFVLTKRPVRALEWYLWADANVYSGSDRCISFSQSALGTELIPIHLGLDGRCPPEKRRPVKWPLDNIWFGVSIENQKTADERLSLLLKTPAAKRWISYEPVLDKIKLWWECDPNKIDFVVAGSETGPGARPCNPDWLRSVRDQCSDAGVPFFLKQIDAKCDRELDGRMHEEMYRNIKDYMC